jgi:hypothetical protein
MGTTTAVMLLALYGDWALGMMADNLLGAQAEIQLRFIGHISFEATYRAQFMSLVLNSVEASESPLLTIRPAHILYLIVYRAALILKSSGFQLRVQTPSPKNV